MSVINPSPFESAQYLWDSSDGTRRNHYMLFRRSVTLSAQPQSARLHIFADTRYRLLVNGHTVQHGPARFYPAYPQYDSHDISTYLTPGENVIAVMVNSYGSISFHSEVNRGGLIVACEIEYANGQSETIVTDEAWKCCDSPGHNRDTMRLSFALNTGENLNLDTMPTDWAQPGFDDAAWSAATPVADCSCWGELAPRSIPLLDESSIQPVKQISQWTAALPPGEEVHSLVAVTPRVDDRALPIQVAVMTHIYAPEACEITLGAWWGRYWLNGIELSGTPRTELFLRQDYPAQLQQGWNTLFVYESMRHDAWDFYLALPSDKNLTLSAEQELDGENTFLIGGPWVGGLAEEAERMALPLATSTDLPAALGEWTAWARGRTAESPSRERAWKTFIHHPIAAPKDCATSETLVLLYDFEREVLGRPRLEFTAAPSCTIDLAYTERLNDDGTANIHGRFYVDLMERCTTTGGKQTWHTFHPRGFRYLEISITGAPDQFELHNLDVTGAYYPVQWDASFSCSDARLTKIWEIGRAALHNCMEDAYLDCPWRERGVYTGDALVEYFVDLAAFGGHGCMRRTIEMFLQSQGENGLIRPGAHAITAGHLPDYSAILLQCGRVYVEQTGDESIIREYQTQWVKLLAGLATLQVESSPLFTGKGLAPYIDIARHDSGDGVSCALNCFFQKAFVDGAWLLARVGGIALAAQHQHTAEQIAAAIREEFWDAEQGVFTDLRPSEEAAPVSPSVHSNTLPIIYGIASPEQTQKIAPWLVNALADNFMGKSEPGARSGVRVNAYFSYYALGALYQLGRDTEALDFIRTSWGHMLDQGAWTTWESFGGDGGGSLCHAWAASPTWYLSSEVLGISFPDPAHHERVKIAPKPSGLTWAKGAYIHAKGLIQVDWKLRDDGSLDLSYELPDGLERIGEKPVGG